MTDNPQSTLFPDLEAAEPLARGLAEMHRLHGGTDGQTCGDCLFVCRKGNDRRHWYKCGKAYQSACAATDWRKKWPACGLWRRADA